MASPEALFTLFGMLRFLLFSGGLLLWGPCAAPPDTAGHGADTGHMMCPLCPWDRVQAVTGVEGGAALWKWPRMRT